MAQKKSYHDKVHSKVTKQKWLYSVYPDVEKDVDNDYKSKLLSKINF